MLSMAASSSRERTVFKLTVGCRSRRLQNDYGALRVLVLEKAAKAMTSSLGLTGMGGRCEPDHVPRSLSIASRTDDHLVGPKA